MHMSPRPDRIPDKSGQAGFKATGAWVLVSLARFYIHVAPLGL